MFGTESEAAGRGCDGSLEVGGGVAGVEAVEVTKVSTASGSTRAGFLPVAAAAPVPAAPPARVPMAAPLPPPAIAPMTAPKAAPPPILLTLLLVWDSPLITNGST